MFRTNLTPKGTKPRAIPVVNTSDVKGLRFDGHEGRYPNGLIRAGKHTMRILSVPTPGRVKQYGYCSCGFHQSTSNTRAWDNTHKLMLDTAKVAVTH